MVNVENVVETDSARQLSRKDVAVIICSVLMPALVVGGCYRLYEANDDEPVEHPSNTKMSVVQDNSLSETE